MKLFNNKSSVIVLSIALFLAFILLYNPRPDLSPTKYGADSHEAKNESGKVTTAKKPEVKYHKQTNSNQQPVIMPVAGATNSPGQLTAYLSKQIAGIVGAYGGNNYDHPADNIFTVYIDRDITPADRIWLNYKLTGIDHHSGVSCSINDRMSFGGYLVKTDSGTSRQRVPLHNSWIARGENSIRFGIPENAPYGYKITELTLEVERRGSPEYPLVVDAARTLYDGKVYVHGYINQGKNVSLRIGGKQQDIRDGEFEAIVPVLGDSMVVTASIDKLTYQKTLRFTSHTRADYTYNLETNIERTNKLFASNRSGDMETGLARLKVPVKALSAPIKLSLSDLRDRDLPTLDLGMTNVTGQGRGVRFLPHGNHFAGEGASVALKYDRTKIPDGYTENDIRTYYFDPVKKHWVALERDSVDKSLCMVVSRTTHFTDMINGVIKAPESPETEGFAPTMMNDIKAADPASKIQLIAPPSANNQGSANLSYPIELPPMRKGMSPDLTIQYNSEGGSGWLGEGWDLNIPEIKVDTRWGVPRYDPAYETETYTMNGVMLATIIKPDSNNTDSIGPVSVSHRDVLYDRRSDRQFHPVNENEFSQIVRMKDNPGNYYWRVTDRQGRVFLYGANTNTSGLKESEEENSNDRLSGNVSTFKFNKANQGARKATYNLSAIAEWKLSEVKDPNRFFLHYLYTSADETLANNVNSKGIRLTGIDIGQKTYFGDNHGKDSLFYRIRFASHTPKLKKQDHGRYGFLASQGQHTLLDSIIIYTDTLDNLLEGKANRVIRAYCFNYIDGPFNTKLLKEIIRIDSEGKPTVEHKFDYYNETIDDINPVLYAQNPVVYADTASLGCIHSNSTGGSVYGGVGLSLSDFLSAGVTYTRGFDYTQTSNEIMIIDLNGDGLPDKVFSNEGFLYFIPNKGNGSFGIPLHIDGAPRNWSFTESSSKSNGWEGLLSAKIKNVGNAGLSAGINDSETYTRTRAYFRDVNNDGLPDIIDDGTVYFNRLDEHGAPSFDISSRGTANPLRKTKTILGESAPFACQSPIARPLVKLTQEQLNLIRNTPLQDVVKVWEVPYTGTIHIGGTIKLLKCYGITSDGIRMAIQHNNLNIRDIKAINYPYNIKDTVPVEINETLHVTSGDRIYFRMQCGTGILSEAESDVIVFSPQISYISGGEGPFQFDGYRSDLFIPSEAPMINKQGYNLIDTVLTQGSIAPVQLKGKFVKYVTNDSIWFKIYSSNEKYILKDSVVIENDSLETRYVVEKPNPLYQPKTLVWSAGYAYDESSELDLNDTIHAIPGSYTQFWFEITSRADERWENIIWRPELHYTRKQTGQDTIVYGGVKYNIPSVQVIQDVTNSFFFDSWGDSIAITPVLNFNQGIPPVNTTFRMVLSSVDGSYVKEHEGSIVNSVIQPSSVFYIPASIAYNSQSRFKLEFYFPYSLLWQNSEYFLGDTDRGGAWTGTGSWDGGSWLGGGDYVLAKIYCVRDTTESTETFNTIWRGWGQFEYNNADQWRFERPMPTDSLFIPTDAAQLDSLRIPQYIYRLTPEPLKKQYWQGTTRQIFIKGDTISLGRANLEFMPDYNVQNSGMSHVPRPPAQPLSGDELTLVLREKELLGSGHSSSYSLTEDLIRYDRPIYTTRNLLIFKGGGRYIPVDSNKNPLPFSDPVYNSVVTPSPILNENALGEDSLFQINNAPILSSTSISNSSWGGASASLGIMNQGVNGSKSEGTSIVTSSYIDMNGDQYPDIITDDSVEYTNYRGSRDGEVKHIVKETTASNGTSIGMSQGYSISMSPVSNKSDGNTLSTMLANLSKDDGPGVSINGGVSTSGNYDGATSAFIDVNGDGLPDRISQEGGKYKIYLNLGYSFTNEVDYNLNKINYGYTHSTTSSIGGGFNSGNIPAGIFNVSVGESFTLTNTNSTASTLFTLRDMNGDGLPDEVFKDKNENYFIGWNTGRGFTIPDTTNIGFISESLCQGNSENVSYDASVSYLFVKVSAGGSFNTGSSKNYVRREIQDMNGDGFPDLTSIIGEKEQSKLMVRHSTIGRTNLLKSAQNMLGGIFTLDYARTPSTPMHPGGKWVMTTLRVDDGITDDGDFQKDSFIYEGGRYDRYEREFLGFSKVATQNLNLDGSVYRNTVQEFDNKNIYTRRNLLSTTVYEGPEETEGMRYSQNTGTYYTYSFSRYIDSITPGLSQKYLMNSMHQIASQDIDSVARMLRQYIIYSPVKYSKKQSFFPKQGGNALTIAEDFYTYNQAAGTCGEVSTYRFSDKGTLGSSGTGQYNYMTETEYLPVFSLPKKHTIRDYQKNILRQTFATWDPLYADHLLQTKQIVSQENGQEVIAVTDREYDAWGNLTRVILPANDRGERMWYQYTYDSIFRLYPEKITDALGYTNSMKEYDYRYGIAREITDINGNKKLITVDNLGRITSITGPNEYVEGAATQQYTLMFIYNPQKIVKNGSTYTQMPYAITKHYDATKATGSDEAKNLETVTFVDGFGRPIQVKKESVVDGANKMIVSGRVKYDAFGRVKEAYYPVVDEMTNKTVFNTAFGDNTIPPTLTTYDVLDRVLTTKLPDNATTTTSYGIADGKLFARVTDANGKYQDTYTTGDGKTVKTVQYKAYDNSQGSTLVTQFEYDAINQLVKVTDAANKTTESVYDLAGRRTQVTHPASGTTRFEYDAAGNLTAKQTANLHKEGVDKKIRYAYTFNRLDSIIYPDHPENNVAYMYGSATDDSGFNRKGRLVYQEDGSGGQEFKYGRMGELTEIRRTLVIPNQAVTTYVTKTAYDSWNRLLSMTYPDGELLTYSYNLGGNLQSIRGTKNNVTQYYLDNVDYDNFEQQVSVDFGNNTITQYAYNPKNRRLDYLNVAEENRGSSFIDNAYQYDAVGNVTNITNGGEISNNMGGTITHTYGYDPLYRLTSASGTFTGSGNGNDAKTATYLLAMEYDKMHNITRKKQDLTQTNLQFNGSLNAGYDLSYTYADNWQQIRNIADSSYRYAGDSVNHHPVIKTQSYGYDANGNLLYVNAGTKVSDSKLQATNCRKLLWDEENRLLALSDNGFVSNYWYDAAGERVVKMSAENEGVFVNGEQAAGKTGNAKFTAYISPYMVVNSGGWYSKHIYMGSLRIASKLGNSGMFTNRNPLTDTTAYKRNYAPKLESLTKGIKTRYDSLGVEYQGVTQNAAGLVNSSPGNTTQSYFYHSDHLGSSSVISDQNGYMVQHVEYVPFGEVFVEERASASSWQTPYLFNAKELDEETGLYYYGARYYDPRTSVWLSVDPLAEKYPNVGSYVYCADNPIKYVDPDGRKLQIANVESFGVLLSSLPNDVRSIIQLDNNGFITNASVDLALSQYSNSGNLQALKVIVDDNRIVEFDATRTGYEYIDTTTGETKPFNFSAPRSNDFDEMLSLFQGTQEQKQMYAEHLKKVNIDNDVVSGNLGATLRPKNQQEPYPGGVASKSDNFKVYVSPVGTTRAQKARNVGHELFSHLYFFFIGRDPRHGGETNSLNGNIELDQQINARELESEQNSRK